MATLTEDLVGPSAAGRIVGVSTQRVKQLIAEGKLPATRTSLGALIPRSAAEKLAAERAARLKSGRK